jgi:hypothetical protein
MLSTEANGRNHQSKNELSLFQTIGEEIDTLSWSSHVGIKPTFVLALVQDPRDYGLRDQA